MLLPCLDSGDPGGSSPGGGGADTGAYRRRRQRGEGPLGRRRRVRRAGSRGTSVAGDPKSAAAPGGGTRPPIRFAEYLLIRENHGERGHGVRAGTWPEVVT